MDIKRVCETISDNIKISTKELSKTETALAMVR
jgi:hypothetical protein